MSIEAIRRLRTLWRADRGFQEDINKAFDDIGFTDGYVERQIEAQKAGLLPKKPKFIKDNVWGMIEVDAPSVRLLDCPVLQRLRSIHQLGLSYLTYPSAEHSRFVHSLGMSYVVSRFLQPSDPRSMQEVSMGDWVSPDELGSLSPDDLVHAALLHDVGHMPFSHATETALKSNDDLHTCGRGRKIADLLDEVAEKIKKPINLAEALSLLIILSDRFGVFYSGAIRSDDDAILRIACLVAGLPPEPDLSGVTQIISSAAIDGDKIDYVTRDALACGIPAGVDVARIFLRSGFVRVTREELIKADLKDNPQQTEILFVVNASGIDTLDEITQSRAALYQRVYQHAVTRTAEAILAQALQANSEALNTQQNPDLVDALGLWKRSDDELLGDLAKSKSSKVRRLGAALRNRQLPKKACAFSASIANMHVPLKALIGRIDPNDADNLRKLIVNSPLENLTDSEMRGAGGRQLAGEIRAEAEGLRQLLVSKSAPKELIPDLPLNELVIVGTAYMDRDRKDCVVLQNGELLRTKQFTNVNGTQDAYELVKAVGFVMSDPQWASIVLLASRMVLGKVHGGPIPADFPKKRASSDTSPLQIHLVERMLLDLTGVMRRAGVPRNKLDATVVAASDAGYFDEFPVFAEPVGAYEQDIRSVAETLSTFEGEREWRVRPETVAAFVSQFPPNMRDRMIAKLKKIVFLGENEIASKILSTLRAAGHLTGDVIPLSPSSGSHTANALRRALKHETHTWQLCTSITEAPREIDAPIIFIDDNCVSATQARAQLMNLAGRGVETWPQECKGEENLFPPLAAEAWEALRQRRIVFVVCAGANSARDRLQECATALGVSHPIEFYFDTAVEPDSTWDEDIRAFLANVGRSVLEWTRSRSKQPSQEDKIFSETHAFGYGNTGGLLATNTNVPASTVTALWCPGVYKGAAWMPLLIRQGKLRHLVLS